MKQEFYTPSSYLLERAAQADAASDFESAHRIFNELLNAVDNGSIELPADKILEQQVRSAWSRYECILEAERAVGVLGSDDPKNEIERYDLLPRYEKFLATDRFFLEQCGTPTAGPPHLLMIGSGPLPISSYVFADRFNYHVTNVDTSGEALETGKAILDRAGSAQSYQHASGADIQIDPSVNAVIVAALAGTNKEEKLDIIKNIASQLQPGGRMSIRYGTGIRRLFYPDCTLDEQECEEYGLRRIGGFEPPRDYMNAIGVYEKCMS